MTAAYVLMFGLCAAIVLAAVLLARYDQHRRRADMADWARHEAEALALCDPDPAGGAIDRHIAKQLKWVDLFGIDPDYPEDDS